jgi:hypothetical protein
MKIRKQMHGRLDLHAEWYHRSKIAALRAEGERLRHELRRQGMDPALILKTQQSRRESDCN